MNYEDRKIVGKIRFYRKEIKRKLIEIDECKEKLEDLKETLEQLKCKDKRCDQKLSVVTHKSINMDKKIRFFKKQIFNLMSVDVISGKDVGYLLHELIDLSNELLDILKVATHTDQVSVQIACDEEEFFEKEMKKFLEIRRRYQKEYNELRNHVDAKITRENAKIDNQEEMLHLDMQIWKACVEREDL
uniref:Uncharacterized protein n=1 Tax=Parastrongyloides trichosuri TaxID=131310 RepID=A0A0N4ZFA7_PARTI